MKKKLLLVLMLIAAIFVMPRVYADEALKIDIVNNTQSDTLKTGEAKVNTEGDVTTITYDNATFKLLDNTGGRADNKAWIGFKITLPTSGISKYNLRNETLNKNIVENGEVHGEDDKDVYVYASFDAADLTKAAASATNVEYTYSLTVTPTPESENVITKTIKVVVVPKGITLKNKEENEEVWNTTKYEENIKKVKVTIKAMKDGKEETLPETAITEYTLKEVYTLTEEQLTNIKGIVTDENLELVGLYTDEELKTEFDATKTLDDDVTVYVAYKTKEKAAVIEEPAPNTVDNGVMYIVLAGVSLLVASGVAVYFKKVNEYL